MTVFVPEGRVIKAYDVMSGECVAILGQGDQLASVTCISWDADTLVLQKTRGELTEKRLCILVAGDA